MGGAAGAEGMEAACVWSSARQRQRETLRKVREEEIRLREV
jgi:hypothetical protein